MTGGENGCCNVSEGSSRETASILMENLSISMIVIVIVTVIVIIVVIVIVIVIIIVTTLREIWKGRLSRWRRERWRRQS